MSQALNPALPSPAKRPQSSSQPMSSAPVTQKPPRSSANSVWKLMLLGLTMNLTACASLCPPTRPPALQPVRLPSPPALTQPIPSQSYSSNAQADMSTWRERLTGTSTTSKP